MVVLKINADTQQEREVKIISSDEMWASGTYYVYAATSLDDIQIVEPKNTDDPNFLAELAIEKQNTWWEYKRSQLNPEEEKEIAMFLMDYQAPDRVY